MMIMNTIYVAIGGFFGAISRFGISTYVKKRYPTSFPFGTLLVNLVGAFLLGYIKGKHLGDLGTFLFGTGFMGAFTTFSTLKLENIQLYFGDKQKILIIYLGVSYTLGILLAFLGMKIGKI